MYIYLSVGNMEEFWHTMSFGGRVSDKKMQAGALWPTPNMDMSFSGLAEKLS